MRPRTWVLLLAAVFAVLQLANVSGRDTPDSRNYLSYALSLSGHGKREAALATIEHYCAGKGSVARRDQSVDVVRFHSADPSARVAERCRAREWPEVEKRLREGRTTGHTAPFASERFMRIFEVRPGYPVFLVPFVTVLGATWGLWAAGVAVTVAGGVLVFLVLRTLSVPLPLALTGQALYFVLPCGTTAMRPMTEGLLLALTLAALWGCALVLRGRRAGLALIVGALAAQFTVKHSQALFLGVCLAAAGAVVAVGRWRKGRAPGRDVTAIAGIGLGAAVGTVVLAKLLGYPAAAESLQDLLADHFTRPDRARPWPEFLQLSSNFWVEWLRRQFWEPLFLAALGAGLWGALRRPPFGAFVIAAAATGVLTQAGHPDITIWGDRLIVLAWLLPVVGVPLLLDHLMRDRVSLPAQGHADRTHSMR
ncbi:hypothetical protein [Streptomyces sp. NPDC003635]